MTNKDILRESYPLGLSCVPRQRIVEMHMSSGSTGTPVVMPYTENDLLQWAECMARCYRMAGAKPGDATQITPLFGLFNGGFGMYHGARAAGLFVDTGRARKHRPADTPGQGSEDARLHGRCELRCAAHGDLGGAEGDSAGPRDRHLRAEAFSESMKKKISNGLNIDVFDIYGMTESGGVGTLGMDCTAHDGLHVWEDQYILEIIDPKTARAGGRRRGGRAGLHLADARGAAHDSLPHRRPDSHHIPGHL